MRMLCDIFVERPIQEPPIVSDNRKADLTETDRIVFLDFIGLKRNPAGSIDPYI